MLVQFSQNNDILRVMAGSSYVSNDIDPRVIFSSKYRAGVCDSFSTTFAFGTAETGGTYPLGNTYSVRPLALGVVLVGGVPIYPSGWCHAKQMNPESGTSWVGEAEFFVVRTTSTAVQWRFKSQSAGTGTLRLWVLG
jgi:hypothetical protein